MLKNVKIGTKLIGGFLMVAALTAAMGVFAIMKLHSVSQRYSTDWQDNARSLQDIGNATAAYQRLRVNIRDYVAATSDEQEKVALDKVNGRLTEFQKSFEDFATTNISDEEKEQLANAKGSWAEYEKVNNEIISLKQRSKLKEANDAIVKSADLTSRLTKELEGLVKLESKTSSANQKETAANAESAGWLLTGVIVIAVLMAVAIGVVLTMSIVRPMREVMVAAQTLAEGDASRDVAYTAGDELGQLAESFRAMTGTIRERSQIAQKIAAGEMSAQVAPKSDRDVLGHALKKCLEVLNRLMREMDRMANEHNAGDIDVKIDPQKFEGDYKKVAQGINDMVFGHIAVKKKAMACLAEFGRGNFEAPLEKFPGKKAFINDTIEQLRTNLRGLMAEMAHMSKEHDAGDIDVKIEAHKFEGDFQKVAQGINDMVFGHIAVKKKAMACLAEFGKGNFEAPLEKFPGKKAFINDTFEQVRANLKALIADATMLVRAAVEGKLATRADATRHSGDFRKIVEGVNQTLDAVIGPLNVSADYVDKISKGAIPAKISDAYNGDFNVIKTNLNNCIDNINALVADSNMLAKAAMEGKLATRADASKHSGDFRKIVEGVNETLNLVVGPMNDFAAVLDGLASGDLTRSVDKNYAGDFDTLKKSINTLAIQVRQAMQQIGMNTAALVASSEELNKVSQQMSASADETAAQANVVSAASDQVSKNVQTVATGADEMGASIKEIAKNTADATKVAIAAVKTAETTNQTIEKLGQSSAEIGQVIKVITSIAQQTNLLALNATIEAARAGEAGKGFAVVANEVKELAKETAKATEDISQKIEAIQADTKGAVSAIAQISTVINQINDIQNTIASAVEEQSATTNEISRNLAEAAKGAVDITKNIGGVAEAARSTTAGAVDTQKSAQSLERMASELQELVSQFKYDEQKGVATKAVSASRNKANGKYVPPITETYAEAVH